MEAVQQKLNNNNNKRCPCTSDDDGHFIRTGAAGIYAEDQGRCHKCLSIYNYSNNPFLSILF